MGHCFNRHLAVIVSVVIGGVDRTGKPDGNDVDIGEGLERPVWQFPLDLQLTQGEIAVQAQVRLHEVDRNIPDSIVAARPGSAENPITGREIETKAAALRRRRARTEAGSDDLSRVIWVGRPMD